MVLSSIHWAIVRFMSSDWWISKTKTSKFLTCLVALPIAISSKEVLSAVTATLILPVPPRSGLPLGGSLRLCWVPSETDLIFLPYILGDITRPSCPRPFTAYGPCIRLVGKVWDPIDACISQPESPLLCCTHSKHWSILHLQRRVEILRDGPTL